MDVISLVCYPTYHFDGKYVINERLVESRVYVCGVSENIISKRYVKAKKMDVRCYRDKRD